jgi:Ran GTPase-activating protein (RanGAP) involved in mRNA processing and transport
MTSVEPSRLAWRAFTNHVDALSEQAVHDLAPCFTAWPDMLRTTPGRWFKRLLDGQDEPRLRFVRCLDQVVFDLPERRARLAWADTPRLTELTVLRLHDRVLGDDGPRALARSPYLRSLRELSLSTGMTAHGVADLASGPCEELRSLGLPRNRIGADGVARLGVLRSLEALHLGRNQLDDAALDALAHWPRLARLDLDQNAFSGAGLERLCASGRLAGLRELNLSNNPIDLRGCRALASCKELERLEVLFLHNCQLTDEEVAILLGSPYLQKLGNLALSENRLGLRSVDALASSAQLAQLYELDVCHNQFDPKDASDRLRRSAHLASVRRFCT